MPIYEYYCPDNHKIYSFFAKTLAQGRTTPTCPDDPSYRLVKIMSSFAVTGRTGKTGERIPDTGRGGMGPGGDPAGEARMEAAGGRTMLSNDKLGGLRGDAGRGGLVGVPRIKCETGESDQLYLSKNWPWPLLAQGS